MNEPLVFCARYSDAEQAKRDYTALEKQARAGRKDKDDASVLRAQFPTVSKADWFVVVVAGARQPENRERANRLAGMLTGTPFELPPTERRAVIDRWRKFRTTGGVDDYEIHNKG